LSSSPTGVPAGVDDAAKVKAAFLTKVAKGQETCALITKVRATELLGTMLGGFNVKPLIDLLRSRVLGPRRPGVDGHLASSSTTSPR